VNEKMESNAIYLKQSYAAVFDRALGLSHDVAVLLVYILLESPETFEYKSRPSGIREQHFDDALMCCIELGLPMTAQSALRILEDWAYFELQLPLPSGSAEWHFSTGTESMLEWWVMRWEEYRQRHLEYFKTIYGQTPPETLKKYLAVGTEKMGGANAKIDMERPQQFRASAFKNALELSQNLRRLLDVIMFGSAAPETVGRTLRLRIRSRYFEDALMCCLELGLPATVQAALRILEDRAYFESQLPLPIGSVEWGFSTGTEGMLEWWTMWDERHRQEHREYFKIFYGQAPPETLKKYLAVGAITESEKPGRIFRWIERQKTLKLQG
jgi:hypothetical protein